MKKKFFNPKKKKTNQIKLKMTAKKKQNKLRHIIYINTTTKNEE